MTNDNDPAAPRAPSASGPGDAAPMKACPICGKPALPAFRPFCSKRCADVDLSRWLNGVYAVPASGTDEDEDEQGA